MVDILDRLATATRSSTTTAMGLDRLEIASLLSTIPKPTFEKIVFVLEMPIDQHPSDGIAQGERAAHVLKWAESAVGPGLPKLKTVMDQVLGLEPTPPDEAICPYKGLSYFDFTPQDSDLFYGRQALITQLVEKATAANVLAVVGASGSGKSSVVRAGLLPQLQANGDPEIHILVPGVDPLSSLANAFVEPGLSRIDHASQLKRAKEDLRKANDGLTYLVQGAKSAQVVIVIDQFEEVFTLCPKDEERQHFFAVLMAAAQAKPQRLRLILTMRSEFLGRCLEQEYSGLAQAIQANLVSVWPMNEQQLRQAITEPARRAGLAVEPELVKTILNDVQTATSSLPLVQYTLMELWNRRQNHTLTLKAYVKLGRVTGTLQQRADEVYQRFSESQRATARHIFLELTQLAELGEGTEDTRRRVPKTELVRKAQNWEAVDAVLDQLVAANLVVTGDAELIDPTKALDETEEWGKTTVEVTHEALIRHWPRLKGWLEESRDELRQQRRVERVFKDLEETAQAWQKNGKPRSELIEGKSLTKAKQNIEQFSKIIPASATLLEFIRESQKNEFSRKIKRVALAGIFPSIIFLLIFYVSLLVSRDYLLSNLDDKDCNHQSPALISMLRVLYIVGQRDWSEYNLCGQNLNGMYLRGIEMHETNLMNSKLNSINLNRATLSFSNLENVEMINVKLIRANLLEANIQKAYFEDSNFSRAILRGSNLTGAILRGSNLTKANLIDSNLSNANLDGSNLHDAVLDGAVLNGTNLEHTEGLTFEQLKGAVFCETRLPEDIIKNHPDLSDRDC